MRIFILLASTCALVTLGCSDDSSPAEKADTAGASATLTPTTGNTASGNVEFTASGSQIKLQATVAGAPASSSLGFHIHVNAECGSDGAAAGAHWNPTSVDHGKWAEGAHHLGDIGNVTTDASGNGSIELTTDLWSIGTGATNDIVNHAVVLHAMADDFTTQPTGNAGGRIACGVIQRKP